MYRDNLQAAIARNDALEKDLSSARDEIERLKKIRGKRSGKKIRGDSQELGFYYMGHFVGHFRFRRG